MLLDVGEAAGASYPYGSVHSPNLKALDPMRFEHSISLSLRCLLVGSLCVSITTFPQILQAQMPEGRALCELATSGGATPPQYCAPLIPGKAAGDARGLMMLNLATSPFGVTVTADGRYIYDVRLRILGLERSPGVFYVVWAITPDLDKRKKLALVDDESTASGRLDWNRFMVVVTAETSPDLDTWQGPILFTAASPSGKMQTMAGEEILWNNELPVGTRYCLIHDC